MPYSHLFSHIEQSKRHGISLSICWFIVSPTLKGQDCSLGLIYFFCGPSYGNILTHLECNCVCGTPQFSSTYPWSGRQKRLFECSCALFGPLPRTRSPWVPLAGANILRQLGSKGQWDTQTPPPGRGPYWLFDNHLNWHIREVTIHHSDTFHSGISHFFYFLIYLNPNLFFKTERNTYSSCFLQNNKKSR